MACLSARQLIYRKNVTLPLLVENLKLQCKVFSQVGHSSSSFSHCYLEIAEMLLSQANVSVLKNSMVHCGSQFSWGSMIAVEIEDSIVYALNDATIHADSLSIKNSKVLGMAVELSGGCLLADGSKFIAKSTLSFDATSIFKSCFFCSPRIEVNKDTNFLACEVESEELKIIAGTIKCDGFFVYTRDLEIYSNETASFSGSHVYFYSVVVNGDIKLLNNSTFTSADGRSVCLIKKRLQIEDSIFQSFGTLSLEKDAVLEGKNFSIMAKSVINKSKTKVADGFFYNKNMINSHQESVYSHVVVISDKVVVSSNTSVKEQSFFQIGSLHYQSGGQLVLKNSHLEAGLISSASGSVLKLSGSQSISKAFLAAGETYLDRSITYVQQYVLENKLVASDRTSVFCAKTFWATALSSLSLNQSNLRVGRLFSDATMRLNQSVLTISRDAWLLPHSEMVVSQSARIKATQLHLLGQVLLEENAQNDEDTFFTRKSAKENPPLGATLFLATDDSIHHYASACISGRGSLREEAKKIINKGLIGVDSLTMTGVSLLNH